MKESRTYGKKVNVEIEVYGECKYTASEEVLMNPKKVQYNNIISWDIVSGFEAIEEVERYTDESNIDDMHEYLILHLEDGSEATFRNSYVDMFRI